MAQIEFAPMQQHESELSPELLQRVLLPTDQARGLPNEAYLSDSVFALERDKIFSKNWVCLGFASDVEETGSAHPVSLAGMPLLMIRQRSGEVRVFHNVCRHRGFQLVQEPCKLRGSIACPYHSWTYTLEGELRGTPSIGGPGINELDGFDKTQFGLFPVRSHVWMNMVFVDISGNAGEFSDHIRPLEERWAPYWGERGPEAYQPPARHRSFELELNSNWKFTVENYCESYHLPWIHPGLNSYSRLEDHYHIMEDGYFAGQGSLVYAFCEHAGISLPVLPEWPSDKQKIAEYVALYPNVLLGLQKDHAYAVLIEPLSSSKTRERIEIWHLDEACESKQYDQSLATVLSGWKDVFREDIDAVEGMQRGRQSPAYDGGKFSHIMDTPTHHFHKWVAEHLVA